MDELDARRLETREDGRDDTDPYTTHPAPTRVVLFVVCLGLVLLGFWLMARSFDVESGLLFTAGLVASGAGFAIPLRGGRD